MPDSTDDTTQKHQGFKPRKRPAENATWDELRDCLSGDKQRQIFDAIVALTHKNGAYPTLKEIAQFTNLKYSDVTSGVETLDYWVIQRTAYVERIDFTKKPYVLVHSPRLRSPEDQEHRFQIAMNRPKLSARKNSARRRSASALVEGTHTTDDIRDLLFMQRGRCWWCQCELEGKFHVDHRIPLSRGGSNYAENLCISCPDCNIKKGDKMPWEFCGRLV